MTSSASLHPIPAPDANGQSRGVARKMHPHNVQSPWQGCGLVRIGEDSSISTGRVLNRSMWADDFFRDSPFLSRVAGRDRLYIVALGETNMGRRHWLLLSTVLLGVATQVEAQTIISAARRIDWTQAGIVGGVPNRTTTCATLNPGATFTQINNAIAACNSGVVFLNAGTYNLSGGIVFNNKS